VKHDHQHESVGPYALARRVLLQPQDCFIGGMSMLWTIFLVLVVLWMVGVVSSYTLGGFIHVLLVLAVIALLIQLIQGRRVV
jgi:Family of unknown function (DUF5670)